MNETAAPGNGSGKPDATMDVEANVYPVEQGKGNLLAFASVTLGGCFAVHDLRVMDGKNGPFVAMPSKMGKDKQYHDTCFPVTAQMRQDLNAAVMDKYQSGEPPAPRDSAAKSDAAMSVDVKVYPMQQGRNDKSNLLAYASVTLGGCFAVNNVRVMNGKNGPFMAMPSKMGKDKQYHDTCFPTTAAMREKLNTAVMGEYQRATQKESVRGAVQAGQREAAARPPQQTARTAQRAAGAR